MRRLLVSGTLSDGRRFRVLCLVDDFTRECLVLVAGTSLSGRRVVRKQDAIVAVRQLPSSVVSDNGTELISSAVGICKAYAPGRAVNGETVIEGPLDRAARGGARPGRLYLWVESLGRYL